MKKYVSFLAITAILSSMITLNTQAAAVGNSEKGSISVNTSANTEITPDVADISFAVQTSDTKSMQNAALQNKEISDKVLGQLKSMINTQNGDYIKTTDYRANPIYSYNNSKKTFERYEVSNRVIVHTKSIDNVGKMIDNAVKAGATNVDSLTFSLSNYESQCNELLGIATKKAKTRAEAIARSISTSIGGINNITTSCSTNNYTPPRLYMAKNMIADVAEDSAGQGSTSISNGVIKVFANVNASFYVK